MKKMEGDRRALSYLVFTDGNETVVTNKKVELMMACTFVKEGKGIL